MKDRPLWIRELFAIALALIMLAPICALLTSEGIKYAHRREDEHLSIQTKLLDDIASNESQVFASAEEQVLVSDAVSHSCSNWSTN